MSRPTAEELGSESQLPGKEVQATSQLAGDAAFADEPGKVEAGPLEQLLSRRQQIQIHVLYVIVNV